MAKRKNVLRLLTLAVMLTLILSMFSGLGSSATAESEYYGESPKITQYTGDFETGYESQLDPNVVFKLPDAVNMNDRISLIIESPVMTLLEAYDSSTTDMSFTEYVNSAEADAVRDEIEKCSLFLRDKLDAMDIKYELGESYDTVMSGFEITVLASDFADICSTLSGEAKVIIGEEYEQCKTELVDNNVNVYETGIFNSSEFGYDGSGTVVAVLDTGLDYYHSAFSMQNFSSTKLGLTFDEVSKLVSGSKAEKDQEGLTASDVYISEKVPFAFDYADGDSDVFPLLSNHGTHVAGVIAGKDDVITGVAPNAQLVIMKIFSDVQATARTSKILAALEDCVKLGVDVINMSIGTSCGFSRVSDKEAISGVYDDIRERGISLVVAASNSFNSTYGSEKNGNLGLTSNPDSATVGSPSTYPGALSVASINGAKTSYLSYNGNIIYFNESTDRVAEEKNFVDELLKEGVNEIEMQYIRIPGAGRIADYTGLDVKGKLVLVKRGYTTFEEKANVAAKMGAAGIIIYNNVSGDIKMNVGEVTIPACSISQDDGEILALVSSGTLKISRKQQSGPFISDFSSWGPTPDLKIKPEITAHGGSILSSVPGQAYDRISGTSMACPNVAGVSALLRQYVKENFKTITGEEYAETNEANRKVNAIINRLMMSSADIILNKNGLPYAVRKQGAGLANLASSKYTTAYILTYELTENSKGEREYDLSTPMDKSKIELYDDPDKTGYYELVFSVYNFGKTTLSYDVSAYVLTEGVSDTKTSHGETTVTETAYSLDGAKVAVKGIVGGTQNGNIISVAAGATATVTVTITLSDADKKYLDESFENGMYVEGFVMLDADGDTVDLNVPYLAFYGDWTVAPLFDLDYFETNKDELDDSIDPLDKTLPDAYATRPVGGSTGDYMSYLGSYYFLQDPNNAIISADRKYISLSNQDGSINSLRFVWAGMLRGASKVEITITEDATGEVVYNKTRENIRKAYGDGGAISPSNIEIEFSAIEENLKNNTKYTVKLKGYVDYGDGGEDTNLNNEFTFPLTTDFEAPAITDCEFYTEYDKYAKKTRLFAKIAVYDNHYAMSLQVGCFNGTYPFTSFDKYYTPVYSDYNTTSYVVYELTDHLDEIIATNKEMKLNKIKNSDDVSFSVVCYDYALNISAFEIALPDDFTAFYFEEDEVTLSPYETYTLSPVVYPSTEWSELIIYESSNESVAKIVGNNKIIALEPGEVVITARYIVNGKRVSDEFLLTVLGPDDEGYQAYDKPVTDRFDLVGYYVNKAFYQMSVEDRAIGLTGSEMKFGGNYSLSMYPSESITLRYVLNAFFPEDTKVVFETGDDRIVTVDQNGVITAVDEGISSVTIKILLDGKSTYYSQTVNITVKDPYVLTGPSITHYFGAGVGGVVSIPESLAVTEIGQFAFSNFDYVMKTEDDEISDELPESMKLWYIGDNTITRVVIPEGIERIGPYAFANLTALKSIKLPSTLHTIDYGAFSGCTALESIEGLENVKFINQGAFEGSALRGEIRLDSAVAIADYAFANNKSIKSVVLSDNTQSLGAYAFAGNSAMESVTLSSDIIKLGKYAFTDCTALKSIKIDAAVIPEGAFNNCTSLESMTLGKDVTVIAEYAFRNTKIKEFEILEGNSSFKAGKASYILSGDGTTLLLAAPGIKGSFTLNDDKVTKIANAAFSGNPNITSVSIPSVTTVSRHAFSECPKLSTVDFGELIYIGDFAFENTALTSHPSFESLDSIGSYAFYGTKIKEVTIPDGVTVKDGAFKNCNSLTKVTIKDDVVIGNEAFALDRNNLVTPAPYYKTPTAYIYYYEYKSSLTSLTIGKNAKIGNYAFMSQAALTSVDLGEGAVIGEGAFLNNTSLEDIDLSKVKEIGYRAFSGYIHYEYLDESYSNIAVDEKGYYKFRYYSPKLKEIDLSSVEKLDEEAFAYCKELTSVVLGENLTEIPAYAFAGCSKLQNIDLEKVTSIGDYAFTESNIKELKIPSATKIGAYAFCESGSIVSVLLAKDAYIGEGAFSYCFLLTDIIGEENAVYIGDYAFAYANLSGADLSSAEYIGTYAFIKESFAHFELVLGKSLSDMGDNPFAYCDITPFKSERTEIFNGTEYRYQTLNFDISDSIRIVDGSIYKVVPYGLELITWCGGNEATVAPETVRVSAMAFAGSDITKVVLPESLKAIGHKAFFDCEDLSVVVFLGYVAPILEEEYDLEYYMSSDSLASIGDYTVVNSAISSVGYEFVLSPGLGIVPYYTYDSLYTPTNVYYGANFVDYIGHLSSKLTMIRPTNGKNYDSFIFNQYFNLYIDGKAAMDDITISAIAVMQKLPQNAADVKLSDKPVIEAARAAFDGITSDEQRGLVPESLKSLLLSCEQMIADLEYLDGDSENGGESNDGSINAAEEKNLKPLIVTLIVIVVILTLAVIALGVFIFLFIKKIKELGVLPEKPVRVSNYKEDADEESDYKAYYGLDKKETEEISVEEKASSPFKKKLYDKPRDFDDITEGYVNSKKAALKKKIILFSVLAVTAALLAVIIVVGIVKAGSSYYDKYTEEGYTVSVTFDSNGGTFKGSDSSIVDLYDPTKIGKDGIKLLAPDDPRRNGSNALSLTKPGYFLAGWYREMTPIDPDDTSKGYIYSGRWDFDNDVLKIDQGKEYSADESVLTLYAAWVPYYEYEIYTSDENGNNYLLSTVSSIELTIPKWSEKGVTLAMDNFPVREGYTLDEVYYLDSMEKVVPVASEYGNKMVIRGEWDEATAVSKTPTIKLYTTWVEGERYRIYSVEDLVNNADSDGYYEIYSDLDFKNYTWPQTFLNSKFTGKIFGNGHTISNVKFETTSRSTLNGGLFSSFDASVYIENVTFENIVHTIDLELVASNASYGLLSGAVTEGALFKNVKLGGSIIIGNKCVSIPDDIDYTIKTTVGSGSEQGITVTEITVQKQDEKNTEFTIETDDDGTVNIVKTDKTKEGK